MNDQEKKVTDWDSAVRPRNRAASDEPGETLPRKLPPFDLAKALARTNGKPHLLRKLLLGFAEQYCGAVETLSQFLRVGRRKEAERLAHSLKSVAATLEASEVAEAAERLETALRRSEEEDCSCLIEQLGDVLEPAVAAAGSLNHPATAPPAPVPPAQSLHRRSAILAVDDQSPDLELLAQIFCDEFEVILANTGESALALAESRVPELVLLDVNMPGMHGFEVCRRLKQNPRTREIPVIFLTGSADPETETQGILLGAVDFVVKPIIPAVVRARVSNQVRLKKAQVELLRLLAHQYLDDLVDELERSAMRDRGKEVEIKIKNDVLSHLSHEFRSPLAVIYTFATLIADRLAGDISEDQERYLQIILANTSQLKSMVDSLLDTGRMDTEKFSLKAPELAVADVVEMARSAVQGAAAAKSIRLSVQCAEVAWSACADPIRLKQSLAILLDNAVKFTPAGGSVSMRIGLWDDDPGMILIEVADTGCGIAPEAVGSIFERLYQIDVSDSHGRRGLGLGLHIAKELVRRLEGKLWVESVLGQGSTFFIALPLRSYQARNFLTA
jgi:signal transduction histidine kinase/HPt (histidine-containing phosphotransfer) domain-containing protein